MSRADRDSQDPLVIMVKPVGSRCNMRCTYCYYLDKGRFSSHGQQTLLNDVLLEKLIRQTIVANPGPVVSFIWHGGEPTLAGLDFYARAVALQQKYLPRGWEVWNNLQTNGLLLDDEWCRFLSDHHFDVGVSIDGDSITHDANRRTPSGDGTWDRVAEAIERLKRAGIRPDLLCTVNAVSVRDPLGVYRALRTFRTGWIQFIPVVIRDEIESAPAGGFAAAPGAVSGSTPAYRSVNESGTGQEAASLPAYTASVTPEAYGHFLCEVFDEWLTEDLGDLDVQLFAETARVWAGGSASVCWMAPVCGRVLIAEEDGSIYSCDHFVDSEHRIGNLASGRINRLAQSRAQLSFGLSKKSTLPSECLSCRWLSCCNGGCPKDRFCHPSGEGAGQYYLCGGLRMFFEHAYEPLTRAMRWSRLGVRPEEMRLRFKRSLHSKADSAPEGVDHTDKN